MNNSPDQNTSRSKRVISVIKSLKGKASRHPRLAVVLVIIALLVIGAAVFVAIRIINSDNQAPQNPPTKPPAANNLPESAPPEGEEKLEVFVLPPEDAKVKTPELPSTGQ